MPEMERYGPCLGLGIYPLQDLTWVEPLPSSVQNEERGRRFARRYFNVNLSQAESMDMQIDPLYSWTESWPRFTALLHSSHKQLSCSLCPNQGGVANRRAMKPMMSKNIEVV
ncbi:hypothetical protein NC651_028921 [Populus alba x Populus x berolinensis]|nr:hypothetical protein NC651_028921 [Populus alba x Populus x berolinensis]